MLHNLLNCQNSKTAQVSKIYLCGNDITFKIGQTAQKYFCQRLQNIRKTDTGAIGYCYVEFNADKPLRDYIESVVRLYLSNKGYKLIGNDHFVRKYSVDRIIHVSLPAKDRQKGERHASFLCRCRSNCRLCT